MNCTIVELARAMINEHQLPRFLWEHAIAHAVYVHNCALTKPLGNDGEWWMVDGDGDQL